MLPTKLLLPYITKIFLSRHWQSLTRRTARARRRVKFKSAALDFYLRVNDPYCLLLLPKLAPMCQQYHLQVNPIIIYELPVPHFPERQMKDAFSLHDVSAVAKALKLKLPKPTLKEPHHKLTWLATRILLRNQDTDNFLNIAEAVVEALWTGNERMLKQYALWHNTVTHEESKGWLLENKQKLHRHGQLCSGMLYFDGEWYRGFDRLYHLEQRIRKERNTRAGTLWPYPPQLQFKKHLRLKHLEVNVFFTYSCPYSYLAIHQVMKLSEHYQFRVNLIPVMIPEEDRVHTTLTHNRWYRLLDVSREARMRRIPFGICQDIKEQHDFQLCAIHLWAEKRGKALEWATRATAALWSEGVDFTDRDQIKLLAIKTIRFPEEEFDDVVGDSSYQQLLSQNQQELQELGFWDAPAIQCNEFKSWGQDRAWLLEQYLLSQRQVNPQLLPVSFDGGSSKQIS